LINYTAIADPSDAALLRKPGATFFTSIGNFFRGAYLIFWCHVKSSAVFSFNMCHM